MSTGKWIGLGFLIIIGSVMIWGLGFGFQWGTAPIVGLLEAREEINSGDFRIQAYNHFFDLRAGILTLEGQIDVTRNTMKMLVEGSKEYSTLAINIAGMQGQRLRLINQYNADASKSWTEGQFRAESLPYHIQATQY